MAYLALARKWRPQQYDQVVGQEHIARTLVNALNKDRLGHAYLFAGSRGIGKTTFARILAKSLNCLQSDKPTATPCDSCSSCKDIMDGISLDVLEIDGASNRGIEDIRDLRQNVKFAPTSSRYKVYIIDEVHMLTREAFNALLKTLEEPPDHVKFFFATTDPHKIPPTIISRCQRFDLRAIPVPLLVQRLKQILDQETIGYDEDALRIIAQAADGGMRDAESILDQLLVFCDEKISVEDTRELLGLIPGQIVGRMAKLISQGDSASLLGVMGEVLGQGWGVQRLISSLLDYFRDLLVLKVSASGLDLTQVDQDSKEAALELADKFSFSQLDYILEELVRLEREVRFTLSERTALEVTLVKLARTPGRIFIGDLFQRLEALEKGSDRNPSAPPPPSAPEPIPSDSLPPADPPPEMSGVSPLGEGSFPAVWNDFLEALGKNRPILKTYLTLGAASPPQAGKIEVVFEETHGFHREALEESRNRRFMENLLKGKLGKEVELVFSLTTASVPAPEKSVSSPPSPKKDYDPRKDPMVREVIDTFEGTVIRVDKGKK